jgi:hypothetical protein
LFGTGVELGCWFDFKASTQIVFGVSLVTLLPLEQQKQVIEFVEFLEFQASRTLQPQTPTAPETAESAVCIFLGECRDVIYKVST